MKKKFVVIVCVIFLLLPVIAYQAYWGRNHKVLYDVTSIVAQDCESEKGFIEITILGSVRNWIGDFEKKEYRLWGPAPRGSIDYRGIECESDIIKTSQKRANIKIVLKIYPNQLDKETLNSTNKSNIESFVKTICFDSKETNDEFTDPQYTLYMEDFKDVDIVWE